jgi:DNA mismatch repair protein MutL
MMSAMSEPIPTSTTDRRSIHILPDALINKIAAGEVVERPASVVKELLENSIDAGATRLAIAIEDGGRTLIRITDNGSGIPADQATLAFAQHATSKIANAEDLFAIHTMGFRGEALASIASVSHATMITRTADAPMGTKIEVRDSVATVPAPAAAAVGTTLEIRDLFYSVPARRKFLRADSTEFGHIHEMVLRTALPNPHVAIALAHNGRNAVDLPATTDHQMRVAEALGRELHDDLLPIDFSERGISVQGFVGKPALARATAKYQYLFLNGRYIRDRSLFHAIKEAYRGLIEPAAQPVAVLFITMDPMSFDVNVHPQKTEVRFRDSNGPYRTILAAVRERLLGSDLTPEIRIGPSASPAGLQHPAYQPQPADASETRRVIADFFKQTPAPQPSLAFGVESPARTFSTPPFNPPARRIDDLTLVQKTAVANEVLNAETKSAAEPLGSVADTSPFVQIHNSYLVAQTDDGLVIIDQHALHERIMYEELYERVTQKALEAQRLLIPEVLPVNPRQQAVLETVKPLLMDMGIEVTPFDAQSIAVQSFPSLLSRVSPREFLRDLLDSLLEMGNKLSREELLHEVLDMASCKAAIKAGYHLAPEEIRSLLAQKDRVDRSSNCPHGRPTTLRLTLNDLEKQFKRK